MILLLYTGSFGYPCRKPEPSQLPDIDIRATALHAVDSWRTVTATTSDQAEICGHGRHVLPAVEPKRCFHPQE